MPEPELTEARVHSFLIADKATLQHIKVTLTSIDDLSYRKVSLPRPNKLNKCLIAALLLNLGQPPNLLSSLQSLVFKVNLDMWNLSSFDLQLWLSL